MGEGRLTRVVDSLLAAAEQAVADQAWDRVLDLCEDVLAVEPDNADAAALRVLAERHVGRAIPAAGRRHVTVMFADLVGSTPMGEALDPESYLDVIRAYETACRSLIDRYGGHINRFAGDGLIAFFGYPHAHEDDADRATRAALAAMDALQAVSTRAAAEHGFEVRARIGVHTGLVVVGDRGGAAWRLRDDAFGPTVNLAARLQAAARPGTVVVSDVTALLLGPAFELASEGEQRLAGIDRPVEMFEVRGVHDDLPTRAAGHCPLVGRRHELDDLVARVERTAADPEAPGRAVLLEGEPGVGKSRLLDEMLSVVRAGPGETARLQCAPHLATSSLHPLRRAIDRGAGIAGEDPGPVRAAKLVTFVEGLGLDPADVAPYLALPLAIDMTGRFAPIELDAAQVREAVLDRVLTVVRRLAALARPYVLAVEDMQWADPMTRELVERIVAAGPPPGLVLVLTSRPHGWPAGGAFDRVPVRVLNADDVRRLAVCASRDDLDPGVVDAIARRSDGVPLYVTQLVDALAGRFGPPTPDEIPLALTQLLQARLDSVGAAKTLAQVAATVGREFELSLLARVVAVLAGDAQDGLHPDAVDRLTDRLVSSHLVDADPAEPDRLRFHHALVRDAAYASQLHRVRAARHRAVAQVLVGMRAEGKPVDIALTAYHHDRGGEPARAIDAYLGAADRASRAGAFDEALAHIARAEGLLTTLPCADAPRAELGVRLARGGVATALGGWAAPGVMDDYARALELSAAVTDDAAVGASRVGALIGIWGWYCTRGDFDEIGAASEALGRQLLATPVAGGAPTLASTLGVEHFYAGRYADSRRALEECVAGFEGDDVDWSIWPLPNDPLASAYAFLAPVRLVLGDEAAALAAIEAGLARSDSLRFPHGAFSYAFVRSYESWMHRARGDTDGAVRAADEIQRVAGRYGFLFWVLVGQLHVHASRIAADGSRSAADALGAAIAGYRSLGAGALVPSLLLEQAGAYHALGDLAEAAAVVDDALSFTRQPYARAEGLRLRAEITAARDGAAAAVEVDGDLRAALSLADEQQAAYYHDRAAASYRRLVGADVPAPPLAGASGPTGAR